MRYLNNICQDLLERLDYYVPLILVALLLLVFSFVLAFSFATYKAFQ